MKTFKGFTLIELIVVMAVFLFIIGAAMGIFISIVQNQKRVLSETQLLNQISYVEEYMSKALRMAKTAEDSCIPPGYVYLLTNRDPTSGFYRGIRFLNPSDNDNCWEFFLDNYTHGDSNTPLVLKELKNSNDYTKAVPLTPASLQFDPTNPIRFSINGSDGSPSSLGCSDPNQCGSSNVDSVQPRVTILLNVKIAGDINEPQRIIQTTVSLRNLNVNNGQR